MAKRQKQPGKCWNPELFPNCQYCQWLMDVKMKVGKKFLHCPLLEAKQMRVWLLQNQLANEMERHATRVAGLTVQLRQYQNDLEGQKGKPGGKEDV